MQINGNSATRIFWLRPASYLSLFAAAALTIFGISAMASIAPPGGGPSTLLGTWAFSDTSWLNSGGYAPAEATNLINTAGGNGNCLLIDTNLPAKLRYKIIESDGTTNLVLNRGSLMFWYLPSWSSTNAGGTGPADWSRLIEIGSYTTNASYGWWSLYLDPAGTNLYFSAQTNGFGSNYVSAPISWTTNIWHLIALTYSSTNSAIYVDGQLAGSNGVGVAYWPSPSVLSNGFWVGSASNGMTQARGKLDDLNSYNYPLDPIFINANYNVFGLGYYGVNFFEFLHSATFDPGFYLNNGSFVLGGAGALGDLGASGDCGTNGLPYLTSVTAQVQPDGTVNMSFSIAGGTPGVAYDVIAGMRLSDGSITNGQWVWLGQGQTCHSYGITNQPPAFCFYLLGLPQDSDGDGLSDAYELLVSKTDPHKADTNNDGIPEAWAVLDGLDPWQSGLPNDDPDHDALTNLREYWWGTQPKESEGFGIWVSSTGGAAGIP